MSKSLHVKCQWVNKIDVVVVIVAKRTCLCSCRVITLDLGKGGGQMRNGTDDISSGLSLHLLWPVERK